MLGGFALAVNARDVPVTAGAKPRSLLAYLLLHRARPLLREALVDAIWPDATPEGGRGSLKTALWSLRRMLRDAGCDADDVLHADGTTVSWVAPADVDCERLVEAVERSDVAALALYRGPFLDGVYDEWALVERERIEHAYERLLALALDEPDGADYARMLLERDPFNEPAWRSLIAREVAAKRAFPARVLFEKALRTFAESGLEPDPAFVSEFSPLRRLGATAALPFLGRERELLLAREVLDAANPGSVVLVSGQAGIGKTALLERLREDLAAAGRRTMVLRAPGDRYEIASLLDAYAHVTGLAFEVPAGAALGPSLGQSIASSARDAVIIVDDFHKSAGDAREALAAILIGAVFAVVATRPEGRPEAAALAGTRCRLALDVGSLLRDDVVPALVRTSLLTHAAADDLYDRTGGYPFAIATSIHARNDESRGDLPAAFRLLLESRIRQCGKRAELVACTIGLERDLSASDLAEIVNLDEAAVLDAIDDLLAYGILVDGGEPHAPAFAHDLFAQTARRMLSGPRRRSLHLEIARRLEGREPEASRRMAVHLAAAGRGIDASRLYLQVATECVDRRAYADGLDAADAALHELETTRAGGFDPLRFDVSFSRARNLTGLHRTREADAILTALATEADSAGDAGRLADVLLVRAAIRGMTDDDSGALADARRSFASATACGDHRRAGTAAAQAGMFATRVADYALAVELAAEGARLLGESEDDEAVLHAQYVEVVALAAQDRYGDAYERSQRLRATSARRPLANALRATIASASAHVVRRTEEADRIVERALNDIEMFDRADAKTAVTTTLERSIFNLLVFRATSPLYSGDFSTALERVARAMQYPAAHTRQGRLDAAEVFVHARLLRDGADAIDACEAFLAPIGGGPVTRHAHAYKAVLAHVAGWARKPNLDAILEDALAACEACEPMSRFERDVNYRWIAYAAAAGARPAVAARAWALADAAFEMRRRGSGAHWSGPDRLERFPSTALSASDGPASKQSR